MEHRRKDLSLCDYLVDYKLGEGTEVERKRFERHLAECPACREDAAGWDEAWNGLHLDMEELEPPADLKDQVMNALDEAPTPSVSDVRHEGSTDWIETAGVAERTSAAMRPGDSPDRYETAGAVERPAESARHRQRFGAVDRRSAPPAPRRSRFRIVGVAIVLVLAFSAGWWGKDLLRGAEKAPIAELEATDRIESLFHLTADRSSGLLADYPRAYGVACIVSSASDAPKQLIVYLFGAPKTEGDEAYQVWLWNDGVRRSAGTLKIEASGIGILALPLRGGADAPIQSIGVTLEPNGSSAAPQGPKLFGSSPDDPAWET